MSLPEELQSRASDLMRKVLTVGVGTYFLTEDSLRGLVSEFKLPKELLGAILESASKSKTDFLKTMSRDLTDRLLGRIDPAALINEILTKNDINVQIQLRVTPKKAQGTLEAQAGDTSPNPPPILS